MPFGLTNSPSTYQQMIDGLIDKLPAGALEHVFAYIDDLCIVSETYADYLYWLEIVLKALFEANLEVNLKKSEFCCTEVKYLGYVVDSRGLRADPEKIKAIVEYPAHQKLRQLRRFLGMAGWYSRFMADYSVVKEPLCQLMRGGKDGPSEWFWRAEQQAAFDRIKKDLVSAPVLIRPDFGKEFQLHCDASDFAIGDVLTQEQDGYQHPIIVIICLLTSSEREYTTSEKECLAVSCFFFRAKA